MLRTRTFSAIALVVPVVVLLWLGGAFWLAGICIVAWIGVREYYGALRQAGRRPLGGIAVIAALALPLAAYLDTTLALMPPALLLILVLSLVGALLRNNAEGTLEDWALSFSGLIYITLLISFFVALRQRDAGLQWIALAFACTWACDSAAYLVGSAIGRRPFASRISPRKTWEGTLGGLAAGAGAGLVAVPLLGLPLWLALLVGAGAAVAAIIGDLMESLLKRQLGVKDFSSLIPGHGGVMDRIDSLLLAIPFVYYVALCWSGR